MRVCAIIAEYNPFHSGHKLQIDMLKKKYDCIVAIMSGNFVQRGDVAIINKHERAKSAVLCGVNLVIELPTVFAMSTAERFAFGGVSIINALGCVDYISFGSECGDVEKLSNAARMLTEENDEISKKIKAFVSDGESYASARMHAYDGLIDGDLLRQPNNILAVEYIKQLILTNSFVVPITHKRQGSYSDTTIGGENASAAAIRNIYSDYEKIRHYMPEKAFEVYKNADKHILSELDNAILYHIRKGGAECLADTFECTEGIENRIFKAAQASSSVDELTEASYSRRSTRAKIRRIILSSLLGINKEMCLKAPEYARVLAFDSVGQALLSQIKASSSLKIVMKPSSFKNEMLDKDIFSGDIYELSNLNHNSRVGGSDFLRNIFTDK